MKSDQSLGKWLALRFALVVSLPLAVVAALVLLFLLPQMHSEIGMRHQALARAVAGQITAHLLGAQHELGALSNYIERQASRPASHWFALLDSHAGTGDVFEAIYIVDEAETVTSVGLPQARRGRREDLLGLDLSRRAFFHDVQTKDRGGWSDTFLSTVSGSLAVALAIPMAKRILIGEITIDRLSEFISQLTAEPGLFTMILDRRGRVIADSQQTLGGQHLNLDNLPIVRDALNGHPTTREFDLQDRYLIGTVVAVGQLGWTVLVAQPYREAFRLITSTLWMVAAGLVLALLLAVGAGWLLARKFAHNFSRYTAQARAIADGDYNQPWPDSNIQEFADLASHLQRMTRAICEREQELADSEARYRSIVTNAPVLLLQFDTSGTVTLAEGKELARLGLEAFELINHSIFDLYCDYPEVCDNAKRAIAGQQTQFTARIGHNVLDIYFRPVKEQDGRTNVLGVAVDITERKRAEEALKKSADLLKESQKIARLGHYAIDLDTGHWESSEILDEVFGINAGFSKTLDGWLLLVHPDHRDEMSVYLKENVLKAHQAFDREYKIIRLADSQERWVHGRGDIERDTSGKPMRMIGTIQDITKHKQLEQQFLQSQKMEAIGQLAGGVAHDFNNMLSVILGYAELIKSSLPADSPFLKDVLEIEKAAGHSRDITRQLLAFSRKEIIAPKTLNLNDLISKTHKTLSRLIGENIELRFFPAENIGKIRFDPAQIDQILVNLAVNARDAMVKGGRLTIETANVYHDEAYCRANIECRPGHYVLLSISDDGAGMDRETLSRVFEPFFTTKAVGRGTGLGLATVYGIIKQNGGFINVYSEPGQGTTFKIYIPRIMHAGEVSETTAEAPLASGTGTVLLVEDDDMVRGMAAAMLEKIGYKVLLADAPADALSICEKGDTPIDLLITDVVMPEMNGTALWDIVKSLKPRMKVLFMSGYTSNVIVHHGVLEEGVNFIQKPFNIKNLAQKVRNAIENG